MALSRAVAGAWLKLWETAVSHIPLPRGLADFTVALAISVALVLIHKYNRRLCYATIIVATGVILVSALMYYTAPLW